MTRTPRSHAWRARPSYLNVGTAPGTLVSPPLADPTRIHAMRYGMEHLEEIEVETSEQLADLAESEHAVWLHIDGFADLPRLSAVAAQFGLHRLALEDILNGQTPPMLDDYGEAIFCVVRWAETREGKTRVQQLSLFLGRSWVISFSEVAPPFLAAVRERLRHGKRRMRGGGPDYLAYAILDAAVDSYFPVLDTYAERLELLEDEVLGNPDPELVAHLHATRRSLQALRRTAIPLREMVTILSRTDSDLVDDETHLYLRDCAEHTSRLIDLLSSYRDWVASLMEVYLSQVNHQTAQITKVLTIIATIFIPLTFLAGIYGMNFKGEKSPLNMPELGWYWGYPALLFVMSLIAGGMVLFFWRRGWLGRERGSDVAAKLAALNARLDHERVQRADRPAVPEPRDPDPPAPGSEGRPSGEPAKTQAETEAP